MPRNYRRRRNGGPISRAFNRLAGKKNFWGKVARVSIQAVEAAGEIKRFLIAPATVNVAPNKLDDLIGPQYSLNGWMIHPLQEGIAQGPDLDERIGQKIGLKGAYVRGVCVNNFAGTNFLRVMVIRTRSNFLLDATPDSPLPADFLSFPRYRDVQVLWDKRFRINKTGSTDNNMVHFNKFIKLMGGTLYKDSGSDKPDKGTVYLCCYVSNPSCDLTYQAQLTYHDAL